MNLKNINLMTPRPMLTYICLQIATVSNRITKVFLQIASTNEQNYHSQSNELLKLLSPTKDVLNGVYFPTFLYKWHYREVWHEILFTGFLCKYSTHQPNSSNCSFKNFKFHHAQASNELDSTPFLGLQLQKSIVCYSHFFIEYMFDR